ncbi:hypothetical protein EOM82_08305 [bacterium]|nr:hypothetical protein [bacterium]
MVISMKRKQSPASKPESGQWLTTYADLMNNLLVLFILLYSMSIMDLEKFKILMSAFSDTFKGTQLPSGITEISNESYEESLYIIPSEEDSSEEVSIEEESSEEEPSYEESSEESNYSDETSEDGGIMDDLDEFLNKITTIIEAKGYQDQIIVERVDEYIYFRFKEGVLFEPDRAVLKPNSYGILSFVADIIKEAYNEIAQIEISGHTAWVQQDNDKDNFASWRLSCSRALTVLEFLVSDCDIAKDKMSASGYSSTQPYSNGTSEEDKQLNRRVEIRISRLIDKKTKK